jgi:polyisoprenoid-binding protein YceI
MEQVDQSVQPGTATAPVAARTTWTIDPVHSRVEFAVKHMMITTVRGSFTGVTGTITLDETDLGRSSVNVEIDAASIDTHDAQRDAHLRTADFLDVERFPTITFRSTSVEPKGDDDLRVIGDLTIRGTTRQVTLDTTYNGRGTNPWGQEVIGYEAETTINRKDFGLEWNVALEAGGWLVGDDLKITIDIQAKKES